ncbi:glutathione synthase/ribosomal protein S6 modification enzyme (glutaminyl transferase) [Desulfocapsa sulfexigens DSM 10523]|uniref:Glutathione synthase/ribosomal protein S6 modification enzyme (Glutaminyl transferase) n=1 Tax=Desulfocapsa sulfexigens (strain DSM 10523 / SB164P1) TaxID=1167006 RepID=M1PF96_DESSD|nr:sugar-transfer associated ATP-grasp domain-containing protein [Desulfocapsa sulfexigens]AGF78360.1 glutathione synthase/ribosomal protein S6 modification enzyme (glutaminyl transferase) [Desulfocapsa sulfexigens DSM 10523]
MTVKTKYYLLRSYLNIFLKDIRNSFPLPIHQKCLLWQRGFLAEKYILYNLKKNSYQNYLSDVHASMARWVNDPYTDILSNKFLFAKIAGDYIKVPKTYGLILNGELLATSLDTGLHTWNDFFQYCHKSPIILKPVAGGGGDGIMLVEEKNGTIFINGKMIKKTDLIAQLEQLNNYLITEYIKQGTFPRSLNPTTTNTMRIVTLIDKDTKKPFIARAVQRIGNKTSAPHDNFTKGGLSSMIDFKTGNLSSAATHPHTPSLKWYESHPDTGAPIKDCSVPKWNEVKEQLLQAAGHLSYLKCIGWDILLTDDGICAIEGNHHPDPDVLQCHGGLLLDNRTLQFYKHNDIV